MAFLPQVVLLFAIAAALPLSISGRSMIRKAPAIFVFGDSLADVGNNNNMSSGGANFPPYGIDFPGGIPTGRFSNGYNTIDWIAKHVGYKQSPPAYLYVTEGKQMLRGVNFASGGSGILDTTGAITFTKQLTNFVAAIGLLEKEMGKEYTAELIKNSLFLISAGGNDIFAYFTDTLAQNNATMDKQFIASLIDKYADEIKVLYKYGAMKFGILGLPHLGCVPAVNIFGICLTRLTGLGRDFNYAMEPRMNLLKSELHGMNYSYGNAYNLMSDALKNPELFGYKNVRDACCWSGYIPNKGPCIPNDKLCSNRTEYLFWDLAHPTEATSKFLAEVFYEGSTKFASPINLRSLIEY